MDQPVTFFQSYHTVHVRDKSNKNGKDKEGPTGGSNAAKPHCGKTLKILFVIENYMIN